MSFNFIQENFVIGSNIFDVSPNFIFYRRGFRLGGGRVSPSWQDIIISGNTALTLVNAKANGLNYLKLFGACELRELPSEYTQLEYIRATGTQYINTGYVPVIGDEIYIKYRFTTVGSGGASATFYCLLSAGASSNVNDYQLIMIEGKSTSIPAGGFFYKYFASGSATTVSFSPVVDTWYTANITSTGTLTTGGVSETSTPAGEISGDDKNLYLFIRANMASPFLGDIAEMTITNNGTTKLNLIPCRRNSDNVLGMYDTVTGNFLTNAGTGEFVAGTTIHNIPSEYTQLNYLRSNGGYINTGYIPTVNTSIEYNVAFASVTENNCLFGTRTSGSYSSSTDQFYGGAYVANSNKIYWYSGKTRTNTDIVPENGVYYTVTCTNGNMTGTAEYPMALFALNNAGTVATSTVMDLAYFKIYESNVLVRNLLPVKRNSDNALGVYDTVTNTFFAGTGDFIAGDDKIPTPAKPMNIISNNGALKFRNKNGLPIGYTQLEYIGCTGSQYITTSYYPNEKTILKTSVYATANSTSPMASRWSGSPTYDTFGLFYSASSEIVFYYGRYNSGEVSNIRVSANYKHNIELGIDEIKLNDNTYSITRSTFTALYPMMLGAMNNSGSVQSLYKGRLYQTTLIEGNAVMANYIPCIRNLDDVIGMYDTVSDTFYTNDGTGSFTGGDIDYSAYELYVDGTTETVKDSLDNTATAEMLLGVGTYKDTQEILTGAITRKVGVKILNGSETWIESSSSSAPFRLQVNDLSIEQGENNKVITLSTHFIGVSRSSTWANYSNLVSTATNSNVKYLVFRYLNKTTTLEEFKQWLAEQYNVGNPVIVVYPLATSTTETVTGQTLTTKRGTNVIEITQASIDGLPLEVSYKAGVTVTVEEIENANLDDSVTVTIGE